MTPGCTRHIALAAGLVVALLLAAGCERSGGSGVGEEDSPAAPVAPPPELPEHRFAEGLAAEYPEVTAFLREFLQTCLNGDYLGYRRLVSRYETPVSRERFEAIYHAIRYVLVESIRPLAGRTIEGEPVYLVVSQVEVDPESRVAVRHRDPRLAILVFKEGGAWRMRPAPRELTESQPAASQPDQPATAPVYPWDQDGG